MTVHRFSIGMVAALLLLSAGAEFTLQHSYEEQSRDAIDAPPSRSFWLGTDHLGRDRWSRLVRGTRVSLLLAISAAGLSVGLAAAVGAGAGYLGGGANTLALSIADVFLCVPWFFLLTAVRGALPLDTGPQVSVAITFGLLGLLGWAGPARIISLRTRDIATSDYVRQARAMGSSRLRILFRQVLPNLRPLLGAQFWLLVPAYIIGEANLGVLGLGVSEPLPSWGSLLRELESPEGWGSLRVVLPLLLLGVIAGALQYAFRQDQPERA